MTKDIKGSTTAVMTQEVKPGLTSPRSMGLLRLHPWPEEVTGDSFPIVKAITVGRDESCGLPLSESSVSRIHAILRPAEGMLIIEDKESSNGTFIDDRRVTEAAEARPGQLVRFGRCTFLVVSGVGKYVDWWRSGRVGPILGGPAMGEVRQLASHFGRMPNALLITGESGTGKEVVARAIHSESGRPGPIVSVNCAAVPETVFEAQFFGHVRGAFTGATRDEQGFLRAATRGTIFLDEVGELASTSQAKLLRALESAEIVPVGASKPVSIDVRVVAATNRDLASAVESGQFRADLYSRLRVLSIPLPPLRERPEDVVLLSERFLAELPVTELRHDALSALVRYRWPGNVRELKNTLVEASAVAKLNDAKAIETCHLRAEITGPQDNESQVTPEKHPRSERRTQSSIEVSSERTEAILESMRRHLGNVSKTAKELGLHRQQVYNMLYRLGWKPEDFREE